MRNQNQPKLFPLIEKPGEIEEQDKEAQKPEKMATIVEEATSSAGLILSNSETIRSFLSDAAAYDRLPQHHRDAAVSLSSQPSVAYRSLRSIWSASDPSIRPPLFSLLRGSSFVLTSPKPREKSEELKARLRKLEELAERKAYAELVKDITPKKSVDEPFSSYKDQLGFGLHVVVTMFSGYLLGYAAFRALFSHNPVMNAAGGILGLVFAMLVETFLFIIRTSEYDRKSSASSSTSASYTASHQKKNE